MHTTKVDIVSIDKIIVSGERVRKDLGSIIDLIESIKTNGLISPITVFEAQDGYHLIAGERRLRASIKAGLKEIPIRIYPKEISTLQEKEIEVAENVHRKDLTWQEKVQIEADIKDLRDKIYGRNAGGSNKEGGSSIRSTAKALNISVGKLSEDVKLASAIKLIPGVAEAKTRKDALKAVGKAETNLIIEEIAKRVNKEKENISVDKRKTELCKRYIVQDFFTGIRDIPPDTINFVEIDPPYGAEYAQKKGIDPTEYTEIEADKYLDFLYSTLGECYRVMCKNSWLILWFSPANWYSESYKVLVDTGFTVSTVPVIWNKNAGITHSSDTLATCWESFWYARKGNPLLIKQGRNNLFDYRTVTQQERIHPTERPIELMEDILSIFCTAGDRILIPFLGSGNTILASANLSMEPIGFESSKVYKDSFICRVHANDIGKYNSYNWK